MAEEQTIKDLVHELAEERGFDLRGYKFTTLERRVRRRMHQLNLASYSDYLDYIRGVHNETDKLLDTVLINVTRFFRDVQAWDTLAHEVLPALFKNKPPGSSLRVWCAGCATGEEPYSVAILLCELLRAKVKDYEIKIYATDVDESALNIARRAEYTAESLRGVRPDIKTKYFTGQPAFRVTHDVRRMVIFGRSNLLTDAPISHVDLLLCRNVLIYFDAAAQAHILRRLQHALNDGGFLFLGKSESQLKRNIEFISINQRWRIFQRHIGAASNLTGGAGRRDMEPRLNDKDHQELDRLKLYYETVLATLEPGVIVLDGRDTVITDNDKILKLWGISDKLVGRPLQETELWKRCSDLGRHLEETRVDGHKTVRFDCSAAQNTAVTVTIKPILSGSIGGRVGTLIYMENVTSRVALQSTIEELETNAEELQSTNEELETTNEELQSTNEELETTNEELQSTNEELETTNEELQSLNEELETTNEELSSRTRELDEVNARYSEMMERMPWPVLLVNDDALVYMFNSAAQKLFGFAHPSERGMKLQELPLDNKARQAMLRRHRAVIQLGKKSNIKNFHLITNRFNGVADVHFTPLSTETGHGVIVMFQVDRPNKPALVTRNEKNGRNNGRNNGSSQKKKTVSKKSRSNRR
ncbi:MAG TPA: protein-glutamate O-methyltransferase CheR [Candidatus Angelobacter sp.]|nr:protein-glutamate O-methyltransferase CheR [Candidatus Angelobacter sp.]